MVFFIDEEPRSHYLCSDEQTQAHLYFCSNKLNQMYILFPAGNSCVACHLRSSDDIELKLIPEKNSIRSSSDGDLHGIRFSLPVSLPSIGSKLILQEWVFGSIQMLRNYHNPEAMKHFLRFHQISNDNNTYLNSELQIEFINSDDVHDAAIVRISSPSLDRKNLHVLEISYNKQDVQIYQDEQNLLVESKRSQVICLDIFAAVTYKKLTPLQESEIYRPEVLNFLNRNQAPAIDHLRLSLRFLAYREKFLAGSWFFLTYFGRDTLFYLLLMKDIITKEFFEIGLLSVLQRLRNDGSVAHEEYLGDGAVYFRLSEGEQSIFRLSSPEKITHKDIKESGQDIFDYKMVDDDFILITAFQSWVSQGITNKELNQFLNKTRNKRTVAQGLIQNIEYCLNKLEPYYREPIYENLVVLQHPFVGDWRDSETGLADGIYSGNINITLVLSMLINLKMLLADNKLEILWSHVSKDNHTILHSIICNKLEINYRIEVWENARDLFLLKKSPQEIQTSLQKYLRESNIFSLQEQKYFEKQGLRCDDTQEVNLSQIMEGDIPSYFSKGLHFYALSLGRSGEAKLILNSDFGFELLLGHPSMEDLEAYLNVLAAPYPLGLFAPSGLVVSNPVFSNDNLWYQKMDKNSYHGAVSWGWLNVVNELGLLRQYHRFHNAKGEREREICDRIQQVLHKLLKMEENCSDFLRCELRTYEIYDGCLQAIHYGHRRLPNGQIQKTETESNPVQLWSTTYLAVLFRVKELL